MKDLSLMLFEMTNKTLILTQQILNNAKEENVDLVMNGLSDREKTILIIQQIQDKISRDSTPLKQQLLNESQRILDKIESLDVEIIQLLEGLKKNTNSEIAKIYKTKENFKGYNLNNLK